MLIFVLNEELKQELEEHKIFSQYSVDNETLENIKDKYTEGEDFIIDNRITI